MLVRKEKLLTKNLILKSIAKEDKNDLMRIVKDPLIKKSYMLPDFNDENEEEKFFEKLMNLSLKSDRFVYGIYLDRFIGFLNEVSVENDEIEVGYFIDSKEWNKGYATEALKDAIEELFRIGFKRVIAGYFEDNPASGRVMEKSGMHRIDKVDVVEYRNKSHRCYYYAIEK